jgi:hypothetical protein
MNESVSIGEEVAAMLQIRIIRDDGTLVWQAVLSDLYSVLQNLRWRPDADPPHLWVSGSAARVVGPWKMEITPLGQGVKSGSLTTAGEKPPDNPIERIGRVATILARGWITMRDLTFEIYGPASGGNLGRNKSRIYGTIRSHLDIERKIRDDGAHRVTLYRLKSTEPAKLAPKEDWP